jgi:hypothetical protein
VTRLTASGSVSRLVNYYISNGVGQLVDRGSSFHGSLQNVDLKDHPGGGHMFLTNSETMQQKVLNDVLAAIHSAHPGCRPGATHAASGTTAPTRPPGS